MDEQAKKAALRMIPYGIYLIGVSQGDKQDVFISSWLMQTSFKPPLIATAIRTDNQAYAMIREAGTFSVSIFGAEQKDLASKFLRQPVFEGDTINGVRYKTDATGAPIVVEVPAYVECKVVEVVEQGDHHVVIAEVINAWAIEGQEPLTTLNTGWKYGG